MIKVFTYEVKICYIIFMVQKFPKNLGGKNFFFQKIVLEISGWNQNFISNTVNFSL